MQESGTGRNSTWSYVRLESAFEGKAEVGCRGSQVVYDPSATLGSTQESARSDLIGGMVRPGGDVSEPTRLCSTAAARQR